MSKKIQKSPWMSISIKPAHVGRYEFRWPFMDSSLFPMFWNGTQWGYWMDKERTVWVHQLTLDADEWRGKL